MRMSSHGTAGARRRLRWHSAKHVGLTYRGTYTGRDGAPDVRCFELDGDDGRTYTLMLDESDVAAIVEASGSHG